MKKIPAQLFKTVLKIVQPDKLKSKDAYTYPPPIITAPPALAPAAMADNSAQDIPKIIWTYWNHAQPDSFVMDCIGSWKKHCSDYQVQLVHPENIGHFVQAGALPTIFLDLHPTKQSDWLRLYLVAKHGGFWLDASTLLTTSLDWMRSPPQGSTGFTGFYLKKFTHDMQFPVVESWAFGASSSHPFIQRWQQEFHHALIELGTETYLAQLQQRPDWRVLRQGIKDPQYLLIHITAQKVLRDIETAPLALYKAEDSAYFYHQLLRWKWYLLYPQLCLARSPSMHAPLIKLRGGERRHFSEMQRLHGPARPGSLWHQALHGAISAPQRTLPQP